MASRARLHYRIVRDRILAPGTRRRLAYDRAVAVLKQLVPALVERDAYAVWCEQNRLTARGLGSMREDAERLPYRPLVSVVTPVYDVPAEWLRASVDSVRAQVYTNWELCLVDDGSTAPHVATELARYASLDPRIRVASLPRNGGIVAASSTGLAMSRGEFVAFLDHDDELAPDALFEVVKRLNADPQLDLIYTDEDRIDPNGRRVEPFFKPDWCPDLLLSMNYICHLGVYRRSLADRVGGFRPGYDGSQDWDLVLRFTEATERIAHVPKVLYHWRKAPTSTAAAGEAKPYAFVAGQRALESALERRGRAGRVEMITLGRYRVEYALDRSALVSILIPTRDRADLLRRCLDSIRTRSTYRNVEILVLDNGSSERDAVRLLASLKPPHRVISEPRPFNWSAINNLGARHARGEYLLLLNNDTEVIEPSWIESMLRHAQRPEVGVVGAKLLYPDDRVQHAGVVVGIGGTAGHAFHGLPRDDPGYIGMAAVARNYTAVTGACMMVRRAVFEAAGGLDESYRIAYGDIDFCLRLVRQRLRAVYTPDALLYHRECATRGKLNPPEDGRRFRAQWAEFIARDPLYNPNLSRTAEDFSLRLRAGTAFVSARRHGSGNTRSALESPAR